jgi:AhpD family alkylhydroperoxidase
MRVSAKAFQTILVVRLFFWNQKRKYGQVLEPGMLWGRSPWLFVTLALLYGALDRKRSPIDPPLRSLVTVRVSQINHCAFCVDINSATLLKRGVVKTAVGLGVMLCAGVFVIFAVQLLILALFLYVADGRNWTLAALVTGGLVLVFSVVVAQVGLWLTK